MAAGGGHAAASFDLCLSINKASAVRKSMPLLTAIANAMVKESSSKVVELEDGTIPNSASTSRLILTLLLKSCISRSYRGRPSVCYCVAPSVSSAKTWRVVLLS